MDLIFWRCPRSFQDTLHFNGATHGHISEMIILADGQLSVVIVCWRHQQNIDIAAQVVVTERLRRLTTVPFHGSAPSIPPSGLSISRRRGCCPYRKANPYLTAVINMASQTWLPNYHGIYIQGMESQSG